MYKLFLSFLFLALSSSNAQELVTRTQVLMGTYASITAEQEKNSVMNLVFERMKKVEKALSSYDNEAEIYRLNHFKSVKISSDTYEALSLCKKYYMQTDGYFDITIGSITKGLYHFGENKTKLPHALELKKAKVDFKGLHFNAHKAWVDEGITIDLGGMGKGFGVDKAIEVLKEQDVTKGVVSLSGDIRCLHRCEMQIQHPFKEGLLASFTMSNKGMGISTSGNYRRYIKSKEHNHLINPKSRQSQKNFASISLISKTLSNSDLDAYATAVSVMPKDEAIGFLNRQNDLGYLMMTNKRELYLNDDFKRMTKGLILYETSQEREYIKAVPLTFQNSKNR